MNQEKTFTSDEKVKLIQLINEGMTVIQEVEDLNSGLNDTVKAIAEEMEIKPAILKKAIRIAFKGNFQQNADDYSALENILVTAGKTT